MGRHITREPMLAVGRERLAGKRGKGKGNNTGKGRYKKAANILKWKAVKCRAGQRLADVSQASL